MKKWLICLMAFMMLTSAASAETTTLEGTVVSTQTIAVLAPAAGTIDEILFSAGERVEKGVEVASLMGTKVYAEESGIARVFGQEGDSVETLTNRYGAVVYVEPDVMYTMSASTRYAYDAEENKIIHPGETVYLNCISDCDHEGVGIITLVDGTNFSVEVTSGQFESGETVRVYRTQTYDNESRIGRGTMAQASPTAYTGSGTVTAIYAVDGESVSRGALLYETVETSAFTGRITAPDTGVVSAVAVAAGGSVEQGALLAEIFPDHAMRLMIEADEYDLRKLKEGTKVEIEFTNGVTAEGIVERISGIQQEDEATDDETADSEEDDALFAVYIEFTPTASVSYGMTAKITTME